MKQVNSDTVINHQGLDVKIYRGRHGMRGWKLIYDGVQYDNALKVKNTDKLLEDVDRCLAIIQRHDRNC